MIRLTFLVKTRHFQTSLYHRDKKITFLCLQFFEIYLIDDVVNGSGFPCPWLPGDIQTTSRFVLDGICNKIFYLFRFFFTSKYFSRVLQTQGRFYFAKYFICFLPNLIKCISFCKQFQFIVPFSGLPPINFSHFRYDALRKDFQIWFSLYLNRFHSIYHLEY